MRSSHIELYVHLVWTTWDREPLLTPELTPRVYGCLRTEAEALGAQVLALGGVADHVHLLVRLPATATVAAVVKQVKGASSHLVNQEEAIDGGFRWHAGYAALSVSPGDVARVADYIGRQEEHHRHGRNEARWAAAEGAGWTDGGAAAG